MEGPVRVIAITDGDNIARRSVELAATQLGLRCISASAGNPTPLSGPELAMLIRQATYDPVVVMVDDKGYAGVGAGESALAYLCRDPGIRVIGAVAVAANTHNTRGTPVDLSVTCDQRVTPYPVDKAGHPDSAHHELRGDTVGILNDLPIPVVVGMGDPGKMNGLDAVEKGCAVTTRAIREILARTHCE